MYDGSGARLTALQMVSSCCFVYRRWASGHRDAVRAVPKYPPGRGSSWVRTPMRYLPRARWASRALGASSMSFFVEVL